MAKQHFTWENAGDGIVLALHQKKMLRSRTIPVDEWINVVDRQHLFAVGNVLKLADEEDDLGPLARIENGRLWIRNAIVAGLSDAHTHALNLPSTAPLILDLQSKGNITQRDFSITARWLESTSAPALRATPEGCMLNYNGHVYRIPEPLFSIWYGVLQFNQTATENDAVRFACLASLRALIPDNDRKIAADRYIIDTKIVHAAAFSLRLHTDKDGFQIDPILFAHKVKDTWIDTDGQTSISEAESLLPEVLQEVFAQKRFPKWSDCRDRYGLGSHYYVYIEPGLQKALSIVRKVQGLDVDTRRKFARSPQVYLKDALGDDPTIANAIEHIFIPTDQYSQRVIDLGVWQKTVLPWLERNTNSWLPERFGIQIGDKRLMISPQDVETLQNAIDEAIENGIDTIQFNGQEIPASRSAQEALSALKGFARPIAQAGEESTEADDSPEIDCTVTKPLQSAKLFLIVDENYEQVSYHRNLAARDVVETNDVCSALLTTLKPHQEEALTWLQSAWRCGLPGVLIGDDMGLGKTLMALAFLKWLSSTHSQLGQRLPILVVAPTGLLMNWHAEHDQHLVTPGLGKALRAYGLHLKYIRLARGRDIDVGEPVLDNVQLQEADWILTTFETLRDYHHSFAKIRFAAAIYDEAQKIKNPTSQLARAAKTVNADFTITMTGTPVENRLEDLWAIMDVTYPGYLPELKTFSKEFRPSDLASLKRLRTILLEPLGGAPAVMIRRMKADILEGLPEKHIQVLQQPMPPEQKKSYFDIVLRGQQVSDQYSILSILHDLRSVSLHPFDPQQALMMPYEDYIASSARLSKTFEILQDIAAAKEKALIFVESLDMQDALATMITLTFKLPKRPMLINGTISGEKRQKAVDEFQNSRMGKFDVIILSPKAGGVGITLTAANHVIHLSRWWNPAVEDQCTDRVYRIGQTAQAVKVYYPVALHPEIGDNSFDVKLNELLEKKRSLSRDVLMPPILPGADESTLFHSTVVPISIKRHMA